MSAYGVIHESLMRDSRTILPRVGVGVGGGLRVGIFDQVQTPLTYAPLFGIGAMQ